MTGRPRACFEPTTVDSAPSTTSFAPTANSSRVSLASSTTKEPSRPCDLPTRPTTTSSGSLTRGALEEFGCLLGPGLRPFVGEAAPCDVAGLVGAAAELDLGPEQSPVRTRLVLVRHADAAGVDDPNVTDRPVELHVRVTADDDIRVDTLECAQPALVGADARQQVVVAARRRVTEQHPAEPVDLDGLRQRQRAEKGDRFRRQLPAHELEPVVPGESRRRLDDLAVGVPADEADVTPEAAQPLQRL